jgi:hypothetical protein
MCSNEDINETYGSLKCLDYQTTWPKLLAQAPWHYSSTMTFTREPRAHWITVLNNTQPYKPLPLTQTLTIIRPTHWPLSHSLYSRYELCYCNTFSVSVGVLQRHFYIEEMCWNIKPKPTCNTRSPANLTSTDYIRITNRSSRRVVYKHNTD